jgi:hypothetical protein
VLIEYCNFSASVAVSKSNAGILNIFFCNFSVIVLYDLIKPLDIYNNIISVETVNLSINTCNFDTISLPHYSLIYSNSADSLAIYECNFSNIHTNISVENGSCVHCILSNKLSFFLSNCSFFECSVSADEGFGGCVYIYLHDNFSLSKNFIFSGYLNFLNCSAKFGHNIFISSLDLSKIINNSTFNFNYLLSPSLLLYGENRIGEIGLWPLKKYLDPDNYHGCEEFNLSESGNCPVDCVFLLFFSFSFSFYVR